MFKIFDVAVSLRGKTNEMCVLFQRVLYTMYNVRHVMQRRHLR
jgi:hypothetical protein